MQRLDAPASDAVRSIYLRGVADRVFRDGLDPLDLHMSISALCFFTLSNRHAFSLIFKHDLHTPAALAARRASVVDMVARHVRA